MKEKVKIDIDKALIMRAMEVGLFPAKICEIALLEAIERLEGRFLTTQQIEIAKEYKEDEKTSFDTATRELGFKALAREAKSLDQTSRQPLLFSDSKVDCGAPNNKRDELWFWGLD